MGKPVYYITTAIAYTSGKPHIGNTYEIVLADAIARFRRLQGYDVRFQTGTDEHGQKIEEKAKEAGVTPKDYVDKVAAEVKRIWDLMNTSYDRFIRTTDEDHVKTVQKIFKKLYDQGDIYKGEYEGMYCVACESFFTPSQLHEGKCPDCHRDVQPAKEEAYFLKLSKYTDALVRHIEEHPDFIQPESRKKEMINNFINVGLQDLCVSRSSFRWGIPVEFDPGHVIYVWIDALSNYITGLGYDTEGNHGELYKKYWPADIHLIGKDILRFHTIYWPIMLMALGEELPKQVFGHPWLLQAKPKDEEGDEGVKMSKSRGNVIYADDLAEIFGVDAVRYFVLHEMPFESDGTISWDLMLERNNSDLANILGNLVKRTVSMVNQYQGGTVSRPEICEKEEEELHETAFSVQEKLTEAMDSLHVQTALDEIFRLLRRLNKYIDERMPWVLAKDETKKALLNTVLYELLNGIRKAASYLYAFLPESAEKILKEIGCEKLPFEEWKETLVLGDSCTVTAEPSTLFQRIQKKDVDARRLVIEEAQKASVKKEEAPQENTEETLPTETKPLVEYDDFARLQFVVGRIVSCENVEKSKKLLCSQVDIGGRTVQILSGIRPHYTAEEMKGKEVMVLLNLKPRKMAGLVSEGMLLLAEAKDGSFSLMRPERPVEAGSEIG